MIALSGEEEEVMPLSDNLEVEEPWPLLLEAAGVDALLRGWEVVLVLVLDDPLFVEEETEE